MPLGKAWIDWDGQELVVSHWPDSYAVHEELKAAIPQHSRWFDGEDKVWRVSTIYLDEVTTVFEDLDYAVRDYTGTDSLARERQQEQRFKRAQRERDEEKNAYARARKREQTDAEHNARKEEAEKARQGRPINCICETAWIDELGWHPTVNVECSVHGMRRSRTQSTFRGMGDYTINADWLNVNEPPKFSFDDFYAQALKAKEQKEEWRRRFFTAWPEGSMQDFDLWYGFYQLLGRDFANRAFSNAWNQRKNKQKKTPLRSKSIDPYSVLGIVRDTDEGEAKRVYLDLSRKYHPNSTFVGAAPDETKMKEINAAWDVVKTERGW